MTAALYTYTGVPTLPAIADSGTPSHTSSEL
jgi:hypothetical protein